jgi:hypothetical protein
MAKFVIKIEYTGYKKFEIEADDIDQAHEMVQNGLENITNPFEDRLSEEIVSIEKINYYRSNNA